MERRKITGLGLGLPHSGRSRSDHGNSRGSHERSYSLHDPIHLDSRNPYDSVEHRSRPHSTYSTNSSLSSVEAICAMTELNAAAATVVGTVPKPGDLGFVDHVNDSRICSNATNPGQDPDDASIAHLKLARVRARSAPTTNIEDTSDPRMPSRFPRADSLLRLDSNTTSKDLKKLLTTRVRHAPSSIDTTKANATGLSSSSSSPVKNDPRSSQFEPEKSRPRVEVYLVLNNHIAVEGGYFSGTLTVRTRKPRRGEARHVRIDGGKIRVIGFEGISETERYAFYQCCVPLSEASEDSSQLYESNSNQDGFRIAREGTFSFPFTIHIPHGDPTQLNKNVPKGVIQDNSVNAEIKYIILASFKVRDDPDNSVGIDKHADLASTSIAHFYRNVDLWPTYGPMALNDAEEAHPMLGQTGTVSARTAQGLLFGGSGMLHLTAVLHRKVWLAGQKCTVYVGAWNETKKLIKTMTLSIVRNASIGRPNHHESSSRKQIAETTLEAVRGSTFGPVTGKGWWAGIEPGATCEFSHSIDVPADTLTVPRTHIIDISYILRVTLVTGSLSSNVSVDLPFRVINAISTDGLPAPPPPGLLVGGLKLPKEIPVSFTFDTSPKYLPATLDPRTWNSAKNGSVGASGLQRQDVSEWTRRTSSSPTISDGPKAKRYGLTENPSSYQHTLRMSQDTDTLHRVFDGLAPGDSMSRLMSELESDMNIPEQTSSHCSSQRNAMAGSSTLKPQPSSKHRVTFLTPKMSDVRTTEENIGMDTYMQPAPASNLFSGHSKEPSSRRFTLEDNDAFKAQPGQHLRRITDTWNDDDADEVLRSIPMGVGELGSSQSQELAVNSRVPGPITGSSMSSDPWSASGSSYSQPSASYQSSGFETSPEQQTVPMRSRSYSMRPALKPQVDLDSILKDETPRAGSVARFRPEVLTGGIRTSSSRATIVPTISSPMLAKSQSAHVVGSPVNLYRRFSPQLVAAAQMGDNHSKATTNPGETRILDPQPTPRVATMGQSTMTASGSARHSILLPPSSSTLTVVPDTKSHLRSHSSPESRKDSSGNMDDSGPNTPTKSTVRSRIAALEERSRSRPVSQYSSTSSTHSIIIGK